MSGFNIPVALFIFKRYEKVVSIVDQIANVKPSKIYLIGDGPRNDEEKDSVLACRKNVEEHITWDCEIIRNYSEGNRGVYENIAGGAKWVFSREKWAIFLEDDNYPAISFFHYCEELLKKYEYNDKILWICGTNYMKEYSLPDGSDYCFTRHMLPCGWASWANKFNKYYDGNIDLYRNKEIVKGIKNDYENKLLFKQNKRSWDRIIYSIDKGEKPSSWDFQMAFTLRCNKLLGIAPKYNQIMNIGVDNDSIHGGNSMKKTMTSRFCEIPTKELSCPLKHPKEIQIDKGFEIATDEIIVYPFKERLKIFVGSIIKRILFIPQQESLNKKTLRKYGFLKNKNA